MRTYTLTLVSRHDLETPIRTQYVTATKRIVKLAAKDMLRGYTMGLRFHGFNTAQYQVNITYLVAIVTQDTKIKGKGEDTSDA